MAQSLESAFEEAKIILSGGTSADLVVETIEMLLMTASSQALNNRPLLQSIAVTIRNLYSIYPQISAVLITYLPTLPHPLPFVEILPILFVMERPLQINKLLIVLYELLDSNNALLLPVIHVMTELPLSKKQSRKLSKLAESAIAIVEEEDLPSLFKILMRSMDATNSRRICSFLRIEVVMMISMI